MTSPDTGASLHAGRSTHDETVIDFGTLRADVATATRLVAPVWPVESFVATNPMRGFEHLPFDTACTEAERWFGATARCPLPWYRERYRAGAIRTADLHAAMIETDPALALSPPVELDGQPVDLLDLFLIDLLDGPEAPIERTGDPWITGALDHLGSWISTYLDDHNPLVEQADRDRGFLAFWRRTAVADPRLARLVGRGGRRWIGSLPDDPTAALASALERLRVDDRLDALRSLATKAPGWCGLAVWMEEWAGSGHRGPRVRPIEVIGLLAALDAAAGVRRLSITGAIPTGDRSIVAERVEHVLRVAGGDSASAALQRRLADLLRNAPPRAAVWLRAHEISYRDRLLTSLTPLERAVPPDTTPATAQLVACIDVRSERLRRHLEAVGSYETFGFAGFFGVPIRWRPTDSTTTEARCPVLVTPTREATEVPIDEAASQRRQRTRQGLRTAWSAAKHDPAAPFALAEASGWITGPTAAVRTMFPRVASTRPEQPSTVVVDDTRGGFTLRERVLFAEAIVSTIGIRDFAPLVVLCGHASSTPNNAHASALQCGACGGAPGGDNARVAAAILNDPDVRATLAERGVTVPTTTWFVAAEHDTTTDSVRVLDRHTVPPGHLALVDTTEAHLRVAGRRAASERAGRLPGTHTEHRAHDWAETRPEWGLARNAAFVIGPRSATAGVDLGGRVFLHSYEPDTDPDGLALETIMTAPLVVAQWISAQYYASSVDPEVFGAGDKLVHNPVGRHGVWRGQGGDLAIGLPWQSVATGGELEHEPLRLLAVVEAPVDRVESVVRRNDGLRRLLDGGWIHLAARDHRVAPWSLRSPGGTWVTWHHANDWSRSRSETTELLEA